jgi:HSP20 family protein
MNKKKPFATPYAHSFWNDFFRLQKEMEDIFDGRIDLYTDRFLPATHDTSEGDIIETKFRKPLADIWEENNDFIAKIELPGVEKEDIHLNINEKNLEIKVEKKQENKTEDQKKGVFRLERSYSGFYRCFRLPENVDKEKIDASYKNGILELKIPKLQIKRDEVKRISVK